MKFDNLLDMLEELADWEIDHIEEVEYDVNITFGDTIIPVCLPLGAAMLAQFSYGPIIRFVVEGE